MSRSGPEFINSILQGTSGVLASLPDVLVYGIGVLVIIFAAAALLASNRTVRDKPATTAGRPTSSCSATSASSHTESSSSSNSTEEPVTREQSPDTSPKETASSTLSETEPENRPTRPTPASSKERVGVNSAVNEQPKREPVAPTKTRTVNRNYTTPQQRSARNSTDSPTLTTQLQRHLIDPVQIETGIDPIGWDSSWGLIKADFSLTGVSADTGGELVYFNAFPSPVSAKPFDSPIELTTTSLIRHLLGTAASSSNPDRQPTARHTAVSTQRQTHEQRSDQNKTEPRTQTHLQGESPEDSPQSGFPSFTEESPDAGPRPSTPIQDSNPHFTTQADTQRSRPPETTGGHGRTGATRRSHPENPGTDGASTVEVPFSNPDVSMTETSATEAPLEIPTERQAFEPLFDTELTPRENETALQKDQRTPQLTNPLGDHPTQTVVHQQIELPGQTKSDEHRPGEATLDAALPRDDAVAPVEDLTHGLEAIGIDSTHFGFDALDRDQDPWSETEPLEPVSDPFDVSDAVNHFDDTELFPEINIDDSMPQVQDDLENLQEPLFETEVRF